MSQQPDEFDTLASALRDAFAPITVERMAREAMKNPSLEQFWVAQTEKACCERPARDGILIGIGTPEFCRQANIESGIALDVIQVYAVSEHIGDALPLALCLESAKRLVNNLMSAIAAMEERR